MALEAYLLLEGIEGQATDMNHEKWIQLLNYNHSINNETMGVKSAGGAHTGGQVIHHDVQVVKNIDGTSPQLSLACCQGLAIPTATIELVRAGGSGTDPVPYQKIEYTNVVIRAVNPMGDVNAQFPTESVAFTYSTIKWTHTKTGKDGKPQGEIVAGWDLEKNTKL